MIEYFNSTFEYLEKIQLPDFSGTRVMMMPIIIGDTDSIPDFISSWKYTVRQLSDMSGFAGHIGYLTIDEKDVLPGKTHRRSGKHVDGIYKGAAGGWGGGWGGGISPGISPPKPHHGSIPESEHGTGFLTVSSYEGCKAWNQSFVGWPGPEGECDHLSDQCQENHEKIFGAYEVYWVDPLCVHESMPMKNATRRQFARLSLPSDAPWFEGYTENPLGIMPTGSILPSRPEAFMSA